LDVSEHKIENYQQSNKRQISIDAPAREDEDKKVVDMMEDTEAITPEKTLMKQSLQLEIFRILNTLPEQEQKVLIYYFGLYDRPKTLIQIGQIMNISRERVRQIKDKAIRFFSVLFCLNILTSFILDFSLI